jgi:hypothetical protein
MNQNQRNKLAEAMRLIREVMAENGGEQLPLIQPPAMADLSGFRRSTIDLLKEVHRAFGTRSVDIKSKAFREIQFKAGLMRINKFCDSLEDRGIIETDGRTTKDRRYITSFRIIKTIPQ